MSRYAHLLAMVALVMLMASGPAFAQTDYDSDNDRLIDVTSLAQLNAIRWDLNGDGVVSSTDSTNYFTAFSNPASGMGCPSAGCNGYELLNNLDFDENNDNSITSADATYWNNGAGWLPIGTNAYKYTGNFKGNGYTINNLFISRNNTGYVGLFGSIQSGRIESLGVTNANVRGRDNTGILAGGNSGSPIVACYVTGAVQGGDQTGGLVGYNGFNGGDINTTYSTASVSGGQYVGGLVGFSTFALISNSYSIGRVSGNNNVGGLLGCSCASNTQSNNYWNTLTSERPGGIGVVAPGALPGSNAGVTGKSTSDLQNPITYTGIYANWNVDVDGDRVPDNPWNFGTTSQDPTLRTPSQRVVDHDGDNDGLIDVTSLLQLNAIRYDLNGDGLPTGTNADTIAYANAFLGGDITASSGRMGCPATGGCTGYELLNNLDFDENNDGSITAADATYWNSGAGWTPIGVASTGAATAFSATFDGNDNTISNLFIADSTSTATGGGFVGLFGDVSGTIRDVGLLDVNITNTRTSTASSNNVGQTGALAGLLNAGGAVRGSYVAGGSVTHNTSSASATGYTGCLLGYSNGTVSDSYATCNVVGTNNNSLFIGGLIGTAAGSVDSTYATGTVTITGTGSIAAGGLIGWAGDRVSVSYATGNVSGSGTGRMGGLIGHMAGPSYANYATGNVSGSGTGTGVTDALSFKVGGLIGQINLGSGEYLRSSYATGNVSGTGSGVKAGGLIGQVQVTDANSISAVYAIGTVSNTSTGTTATGGLAAQRGGSITAAITYGRWDTQTTGQSTTAGTLINTLGGLTTSALQSPTGYTGSYLNWNQNLDGQAGNDDPWYFGATNQYPVLKYAGLDTTAQLALQPSIPPRVAVTSNGDTLYVHWRAASQATGYTVQWKSGMQSYDAAREATPTATFLKIPLASGTTYTVRVIASKTGARDGSVEVMRATGLTNYDTDGDGLIAITTLAQLNAMRWDLDGDGAIDASASTADTTAYNTAFPNRDTATRMGCFPGCTGYELLANLDFDTSGDGEITAADATYWNGGAGWDPVGPYGGTFKGNNKTISHLFINRGSRHNTGLFQAVDGDVSGLGLLNVNVTGADRVGGLAGNQGGGSTISSCYVTGRVSGSKWGVGGLVGRSYRTSGTNRIVSSYALVSVRVPAHVTSGGMAGGLVGWLTDQTEVVASYALGTVFAGHSSAVGGGLVGQIASGSDVTASYATGAVTGAGTKGGLVGSSAGTVTDSYWDTQTSGIVDDSDTVAPEGKLTADLQSITSASGIYANWDDLTIDASGTNDDDPWTFGTTKQYPVLTFAGLDTTAQYAAQPVHYDTDSDGLLEVSTLAQLHAMRWDINGDGAIDSSATTADTTAYNAAFPNGNLSASKGCPSSGCTGYELLNNLDFDENNDGAITQADTTYWNSGQGWMPIGSDASPALRYTGDFKGNGYTVQNLFISRSAVSYQALFGGTGTNSRIESLGVTDADVTADDFSGILVGGNRGEIVACYTTGSMTGDNVVGGLVGWTGGAISTSYSLASVSATQNLGGLVGSKAAAGSITNSYSTGAVSLSSGSMTSIGGLLGESNAGTGTVSGSYWDTQTSGRQTSFGGSGAAGKTTSELQSPTTYGATSNDTYYGWNANIDGQAGNDDPWTFGAMDQYPALKYAGLDTTVQFQLQPAIVTLALTPSSISESGGMSTVTATLAHPLSATTTITVRPVAGAYTVGTDSTITIAAGQTANASDTVVITAVDNTRDAPNRDVTVTVVADNDQGSVVLPTAITITDDDPPPRLSISSPSAVEGTALTFTVRLNEVSGKEVTVAYADASTGTATSGTDYTALTAGTLTFAAGTTSQTIAVSVTDDSDDEQNETVIVTLSSATNATISTAQGTGTIIDDDGMPTLSIGSPSVIEGATSATLTFRVYLRPAHNTLQVTVAYADAGTGTATSGTDYTALTAGTLTFAVGDTIQTIAVSVTDDSDDEQNETVIVTLSSATNATISTAQGTGTIIDDETPSANLDVDGDGRVRLFSDIILVIRYVLFFREEALLRGNVIEPTATRKTAQEIEPYLDTLVNQNILDVDGDGDVRLFSDIILIIRYVLFFRNEALLRGNVIEQNATRTTAQAIEPYIRSLYPDSHFQ